LTHEVNNNNFNTLALHAGQEIDPHTLSRGVPLHRTSAYLFRNAEHASNLFSLKESGNIYTRLMNPTTEVLEKRMTVLEDGVGALAVASGTSAIYYSLINIIENGQELVSSRSLYGGTYTMFNDILPQFGIKTVFVDGNDPQDFRKAITDRTRAIFLEAIGNPKLEVPDFEGISAVAREAQLPLIVDSTFATPYLCRPIEYGADIVVHSLTKWIGGHGTAVGGIVVDSGKFNWRDGKFRMFVEPEPSYSGIRFAYDLGDLQPLAYILRMRLVALRNLGACLSPDNAWMFLQGLETLGLRMERHCANALVAAKFLEKHPKVKWVRYPGLPSDASNAMADRYFRDGLGGGVVVFGIKGNIDSAETFINSLRIFSHVANVGDAKSLAICPAFTTHSQLSLRQQNDAGISADLVRLSVGIENVDDLVADLDQALSYC
jgi:O-acetylhomoserine (thiol)-lyase